MVRKARPSDGDVIADIYLESFHTALPHIELVHSDAEVRTHFATVVTNELDTWVAVDEEVVLGFLALGRDHVDHLYLRPAETGRGFGGELLELAKRERPDGLRLYTFQANRGARRFYEHHGFVAVDFDDGERNEEGEPDVHYEWAPNPAT